MSRPRKPRTPEATAELPRVEHLRAKLVALEELLESGDARRNAMAFVSATRLATNLRAEIEELVNPTSAPAVDPTAAMGDGELVSGLVSSVAHLPDDVVDRLEEAIRLRRGGRPRLVAVSGST